MRLTLSLLSLLTLLSASQAADWPMGGRASDRNPVSPEKNGPTSWQIPSKEKQSKNIRWQANLKSSLALGGPIVSGGLVWVGTNYKSTSEVEKDYAVLACYRESDGKPLYRYLSPRRGKEIEQDWPCQSLSGSPFAEKDRLWFVNNRREVICLDVAPLQQGTGEPRELWKVDMVDTLKIYPRTLMFSTSDLLGSPTAYKDFLYVPTGNGMGKTSLSLPAPEAPSLVCLRKDTGKVVWSDNSPGKNMLFGHSASPLVIEIEGVAQVIHPQADGWVRSFNALTGKLLWKFDCNRKEATGDRGIGKLDGRVTVMSTPIFYEGKLYFGTGVHLEVSDNDLGRLFCLDPRRRGDVSSEVEEVKGKGKPNPNSALVWEYVAANDADSLHHLLAGVTIQNGLLFAADVLGILHCFDANTGKRYWWHDIKGMVLANPLIVDGKVYVGSVEGDVFIFEESKEKRLLARHEFDKPIQAPLIFANGSLYVLTDGDLFAIAEK